MTDLKRCRHCGGVLDPEDDFLAQPPQTNRERIRNVLSEALDTPVPSSPFMVDKWDKGLDSIIADCRAVVGKKILDADLASQIIAAIRLGVETDEWALLKADYPNAAVVGCIPRLLREYQDKSTARSEWAETVERSQAYREANSQPVETPEQVRWGHACEELCGQMLTATFVHLFRGSSLRSANRAYTAVVEVRADVKETLELRWADRVAEALGVETVTFEVVD